MKKLISWQDLRQQTRSVVVVVVVVVVSVYFFSNKHEIWNEESISDLNDVTSAQRKHSESQTHMRCYLHLKLCGKPQKGVDLLDAERRTDVIRLNEQVKRNRSVERRFVDAVRYSANQELAFRAVMGRSHF
jgi:hypothetical protein